MRIVLLVVGCRLKEVLSLRSVLLERVMVIPTRGQLAIVSYSGRADANC